MAKSKKITLGILSVVAVTVPVGAVTFDMIWDLYLKKTPNDSIENLYLEETRNGHEKEKPADKTDKKPADKTDKKPADKTDKKPADITHKKPTEPIKEKRIEPFPYDVKKTKTWKIIPKDFDFSKITKIPWRAFEHLEKLPDDADFSNIEEIGGYAFKNLKKLPENVNLWKLESVSRGAFESLREFPKNIKLSNLKNISALAFMRMTKLPEYFALPRLERVYDEEPDFIKGIRKDREAFSSITNLPKGLMVNAYASYDNISRLFKTAELNDQVKDMVGESIEKRKKLKEPIRTTNDENFPYDVKQTQNWKKIPEGFDFSKIKKIPWMAFDKLETLPPDVDFSNIEEIGGYAFRHLKKLPENIDFLHLRKIGRVAFWSLRSLPRIADFSQVTHIGTGAFNTIEYLPENIDVRKVKVIGRNAFWSLRKFPKNIKFSHLETLGVYAFMRIRELPENFTLQRLENIDDSEPEFLHGVRMIRSVFPYLTHLPKVFRINPHADYNRIYKLFKTTELRNQMRKWLKPWESRN